MYFAEPQGHSSPFMEMLNLTFEEQKEILLSHLVPDLMKQRAEIKKQLRVDKMCFQTEQTRLSLQQYRLNLIKSGKSVTITDNS